MPSISRFHLLDSGALYRLLALAADRRHIGTRDATGLSALATQLEVAFVPGQGDPSVRVLLDGQPVDDAIRTEECGQAASLIAVLPPVRLALLARQRAFRQAPGLVADGRDMGTVVFPEAQAKIYLTATPEERARRRHKQLIAKGIGVTLRALFEDVSARDKRDRERSVSPLQPAEDAIVIDTTGHDVPAVFGVVLAALRARDLPA